MFVQLPKEKIMSEETTTQPLQVVDLSEVDVKENRFRTFITKHPRISQVAGFTTAIFAVVGVVSVAKGLKSSSSDVSSTADVQELVSLETTETPQVQTN
jgi:hypothetical protein